MIRRHDLETSAASFLPPLTTPIAPAVTCPASHGAVAVTADGCKSRRTLNLSDPNPLRCSGEDCPRYRSDDLPVRVPLPPGARVAKSGNVYVPYFDADGRCRGGHYKVLCPVCGKWRNRQKPHRQCEGGN